jgi:hypothetical protein
MPTYTFRRPDGALSSRKLSFEEYELVRSGDFRVVDDEGTTLELVFNPGSVGFVLKDGPSGGWMSKANKENGYRKDRGAVMSARERNHVFKTKLIPNYQGQEASNWSEVRDEVRRVKGAAAASTYDQHVKSEVT